MEECLRLIKDYIYLNSKEIHNLKLEAIGADYHHIRPTHPRWAEYIGRKREVTKFLVALHLVKGNPDKVKNHTDSADMVRLARRSIYRIMDYLKKELSNV